MSNCEICGHYLVSITAAVRRESKQRLAPNFRTLKKLTQSTYVICPICDAYALGAELETGFIFTYPDGAEGTVHDLI